jgi:hypothetical protein
MRTLQRVGAGLFALTLFTGLAACGDDDDDGEEGAEATDDGGEEAAGPSDQYCEAVVDFNGAATQVDLDESSAEADIVAAGEQLAPLSETLASEAPEDLAGDAEVVDAAVQDLTTGDATAFNDDASFEAFMGVISGSIEACEFETVDVTGVDYAFEGVPESIPAGTVAFSFQNEGEEPHEMLIFRKVDGVTESFDEIFSGPEEASEGKVEFSGVTFAEPGDEGSALTDLSAGDYAMVCFVPVGGGEDGPPHFTEGMVQEFTVE